MEYIDKDAGFTCTVRACQEANDWQENVKSKVVRMNLALFV
jgi:hypothetical protein